MRSHHELMLARGWWQAGCNRYLRRLASGPSIAVFHLERSSGGGWGWATVGQFAGFAKGGRHPSRLSAARAAEAAAETIAIEAKGVRDAIAATEH